MKVGRVKEGGTAHAAGLRHGDYIVKINGQNICRSSAESVASIVRHAEHMVVLDLYRSNRSRIDSSCASSRASSIPSIDLNHAIIESQDENCPPSLVESKVLHDSRRSVVGSSCKNIVHEQTLEDQKLRKKLFVDDNVGILDRNESKCGLSSVTDDQCKWDPEISAIETVDSVSRLHHHRHKLKNYISVPDLSELDEEVDEDGDVGTMATAASLWQHSEQDFETSWMEESLPVVSDPDCSMTMDMELPSQPDCSIASRHETALTCTSNGSPTGENVRRDAFSGNSSGDLSVGSSNKSHSPLTHPSQPSNSDQSSNLKSSSLALAVQKLIQLEKQFSEDVQQAIQCYSRPMRHCLASTRKHQMLFQNLEKVAAISGFLAKQMEGVVVVGAVYASRVSWCIITVSCLRHYVLILKVVQFGC